MTTKPPMCSGALVLARYSHDRSAVGIEHGLDNSLRQLVPKLSTNLERINEWRPFLFDYSFAIR